jgi:hypothetical protein
VQEVGLSGTRAGCRRHFPPPLALALSKPVGLVMTFPRIPIHKGPCYGCGARNYPLSVSGPNYYEPVSDDPIILPGLIK